MKIVRRIGRVILVLCILFLAVVLAILIAFQLPSIQSKVAKYGVEELNRTFGTEVKVDSVAIDFPAKVNLYGVSTKDSANLEFLHIKNIKANIALWALLKNPNNITIKHLTLIEPNVKVITYKGQTQSNFIKLIKKFESDNKEPSDFKLKGDLDIVNGSLSIVNQNLEENKKVWLNATEVNTIIKDFSFEGTDVKAALKSMNFKAIKNNENYVVENFSSDFHYSEKEIRLDNLNLKTNDSQLNGYVVFSYNDLEALTDFENKVQWDAAFKQDSYVNFKDIRYFAPDFNKNNTLKILGNISGTLANMKLDNVQLNGNGVFVSASTLNLANITRPNDLIVSSTNLKAKTSYNQLADFLPNNIAQKVPSFFSKFGTMDYNGNLNLDSNQITLNGLAITTLGTADLKVSLLDYKSDLKYQGTIAAQQINLKQLTQLEQLGFVSGNLTFSGQGTDLVNLNITTNGTVDYIDILGVRYDNVVLDGTVAKSSFQGYLSINDERMKGNYNGLFDFSKKPYHLNFESTIDYLNLDALGLTENQNASLKTNASGNIQFSSIDDFLGELTLKNTHFKSKSDTLNLEEAHITSSKINDIQKIALNVPNYLKGEIDGQFKISELPKTLTNAIGSTALLVYNQQKVAPNQHYSFFFEIEQNLFSIFNDKIEIAPGTIFDGKVNANNNYLTAELNSQKIGYDGITLFQPLINIDTSKSTESIAYRGDSLQVKNVTLYDVRAMLTPIADSLEINTDFKIGKKSPMNFDLNLFHTVDEDKNLVFGFSPSTIEIDQNKWQLNPNNDRFTNRMLMNLNKNYYEVQNIELSSDGQRLNLNGYYKNDTDFVVNADLEQLFLSKIIPKDLLGSVKIDGIANGNIDITRSISELKPLMGIKIDSLAINDYGLGDLTLNGTYNVNEKVFDIEGLLDQEEIQALYFNGFIDNKPKTPEISISASLDDFKMTFLESFLSAAMSNIRGTASGNVAFNGPINSPDFEGTLDVEELGFKVDYLGVDYIFPGVNSLAVAKQSGGQGYIDLDQIAFRDSKYNTKGEVTGSLLFRDFSTWFLNLAFVTNNLLVLDTSIKENELFYGKVFGQGNFQIYGPPSQLEVTADAIINENTELTINTGSTIVEGQKSLVRFVPTKIIEGQKTNKLSGVTLDLNVTATPTATLNLIFDPTTDDKVIANGNAQDLRIKMQPTSGISIDGTYTISSGRYEFRRIPGFPKDFLINPNSKINFTGSPYDAELSIVASYPKTVANVGSYLGVGFSQTYDVDLTIAVSKNLKEPSIELGLTIPKAGADVQSQLAYKFNALADEKTIQFGSILVFGQFNTNSSALAAGLASTGADLVLSQLGSLFSTLIKDLYFDFDYVTGESNSSTSDRFGASVRYNLNPRWSIKGATGVPLSSTYNESLSFESELLWDISKRIDGSFVVNFFTRPTTFGVENFNGTSNNQSYGAGITYKTSFNKIGEIFEKEEKEEVKETKVEPIIETTKDSIKVEKDATIDSIVYKKQNTVQPLAKVKTTKVDDSESKPKSKKKLVRFK